MSVKPVKKAKRKEQHKRAIAGYEKWLKKHPNASHRQKFSTFDSFVDSSLIDEVFEHAVQTTAA